jgi:hypothetical protein
MKSVVVIVFAFFISACGTTYQVPAQNNGLLPWGEAKVNQLKPSSIEVNTPHKNLEEVKFIVLLSGGNHKTKEFKEFSRKAVDLIGFKNILTHTEYVRLIINNRLDDKIEAKYDLLSLHKAYKELGNFLVISMYSNNLGGAWFEMGITVTDPKSSETLLKVSKESVVWANMDTEFSYPIVNVLNDWKNNSIHK